MTNPSPSAASSWLPKVAGAVGATLALVAFLALTLLFPQVADSLFEQGGKAPLLLGLAGLGAIAAGYWSCEQLTARLLRR